VRVRLFSALFFAASLAFTASASAYPKQAPKDRAAKFKRVYAFGEHVKELRAEVAAQLKHPKADLDTAIAAIVATMDLTTARIGSGKYAQRKVEDVITKRGDKEVILHREPSFGISSLRKDGDQVTKTRDGYKLKFMGKEHVLWERTIKDPKVVAAIDLFMNQPGPWLWSVPGKNGKRVPVKETDVGPIFKKYGAKGPHDLRRWRAIEEFDREIAAMPKPTTLKQALEQRREATARVAKTMGHTTPQTTIDNYLDPKKYDGYGAGLK
jgi:DNA topoisomerase IB